MERGALSEEENLFIESFNHSIQRTGANRSARAVLVAHRRLTPADDADR